MSVDWWQLKVSDIVTDDGKDVGCVERSKKKDYARANLDRLEPSSTGERG